jgi:hypothetical protein
MLVELATEHLLPVLAQEMTAFAVRYLTSQAVNAATPRSERSQCFLRPNRRRIRSTEIISDIPGRARLRVLGMRGNPARAAAAVRRCGEIPGVVSVAGSSITGTILIHYNRDATTLAKIRSNLDPPPKPARLPSARRFGSVGRTLARVPA